MSKNSFLKQATILGAAGILIKIIGAAFKIPLGNKIGAVGMGYYYAPYSVYMWLMVLSSVGIPTAIAIMVTEREALGDRDGIIKIIKTVSKPMMILAVILFAILFFGANIISNSIKINESMYGFMALAPALLAVPMLSIFRGYFQGIQNLKPYALSQIIEQLTRVIIGLSLAYLLFDYH